MPNLAVDAIVTKKIQTMVSGGGSGEPAEEVEEHEILLITRGRDPFKGMYAYPGGFVDYGEDPANSVIRELKEEIEAKDEEFEYQMQDDVKPDIPDDLNDHGAVADFIEHLSPLKSFPTVEVLLRWVQQTPWVYIPNNPRKADPLAINEFLILT